MTKPTWVFVAGSYRTASTTQYRMVRDVVKESHNGIGIGYHKEDKLVAHDEPGNRYVVCKVFEFLPGGFQGHSSVGTKFLRQKRIKAVISVRNPLDIIVSMKKRSIDLGKEIRNKRGKHDKNKVWSFQETATVNFPTWLGWAMKWVDLGPNITLVSRFEDFTTDLHYEVHRIAAHLDIRIGGKHGHEIADRYTVQAIRDEHKQRRESGNKKPTDPWLPSIPAIVFGSSDLYKTWLTQEEQEMVIDANRDFMERFGYL